MCVATYRKCLQVVESFEAFRKRGVKILKKRVVSAYLWQEVQKFANAGVKTCKKRALFVGFSFVISVYQSNQFCYYPWDSMYKKIQVVKMALDSN